MFEDVRRLSEVPIDNQTIMNMWKQKTNQRQYEREADVHTHLRRSTPPGWPCILGRLLWHAPGLDRADVKEKDQ